MERIKPHAEKQAHKIRDLMSWDHLRLDQLFEKFLLKVEEKSAVPALDAYEEFLQGLKRHIQREEEILFPLYENQVAFRQETGPEELELASEMRDEHHEVMHLLEEIEKRLKLRDLRVAGPAQHLHARLKQHQEREEQLLYTWLDDTLGPEAKEEAARKISHELVSS